jgi:O-succinylbenzoic acid--CoA ligase
MNFVTNKTNWLLEQSKKYGQKPAIIYGESSLSYSYLFEQSARLSAALLQKGILPGDKIAVLLKHSPEFIFTINALWLVGAIPVLINTRNTFEEIEYQTEFTDAKFLLADLSGIDKVKSIKSAGVLLINELYLSRIPENIISNFDLNNTALILFTSGSTRKPKTVVHTFNNLYQSVLLTHSFSPLSESDIWLGSLPFYHIGGFMIIIRSLISGATLTLPETTGYIDIIDALVKYNPTHVSLVSTTLKQLIDNKAIPNQNLKQLYLGGGHLDTALCSLAINNGFPIVKVYGSTETCSMVSALSTEDFSGKPESVGKPLGDTEIKIADNNGSFLESYKQGEIFIRSKSLLKEYFSDTNESNKKLTDGYYRTGDFGWLDNEGFLHIELRREDLIVTGGENVNPKEVEQFIIQLPSIIDTYVFAEPDETWGQIICAAIVTNSGITANELKEQLRNMMASFKVPKKFYFLEKIPRNDLGKVEKEELIELLK